jgi:uncharacterized protein (DUF3084 family)
MQLEFSILDKNPVELKLEFVEKEVNEIRKRSDNVRRGLFARHNELAKLYMQQQSEIERLKQIIEALGYGNREWEYGQQNCLFNLREA